MKMPTRNTFNPAHFQFNEIYLLECNIIDLLESVIIIMSRHQHEFPWLSPTTRLYCLSLSIGLQDYILYRHRAVVYRF